MAETVPKVTKRANFSAGVSIEKLFLSVNLDVTAALKRKSAKTFGFENGWYRGVFRRPVFIPRFIFLFIINRLLGQEGIYS